MSICLLLLLQKAFIIYISKTNIYITLFRKTLEECQKLFEYEDVTKIRKAFICSKYFIKSDRLVQNVHREYYHEREVPRRKFIKIVRSKQLL